MLRSLFRGRTRPGAGELRGLLDRGLLKSRVKLAVHGHFTIPYDDYRAENALFFEEIVEELACVLSLRDEREVEVYLREFEREYASFLGVSHAVGVSSGTAALSLSLVALGVGPGDEVITTPHTYIATALAIADAGARPVFADIGEDFNIDPDRIEERITPRTKAIMPVHLYGNPCAMDRIMELARGRGLHVVEDACQAQGAAIDGRKAGTFGRTGCFSFHPSKLIGGLGDGGMVATSDRKLAERVRGLRQATRDDEEVLRSRRTPACLDPLHVPFLRVKLRHVREILERRRRIAGIYDERLAGIPRLKTPVIREGEECCFRNYTLRAEDRDDLIRRLFARGIQAKVFYETPLHLRNEFKRFGYSRGDFPACEKAYGEIVSLPISHALGDDQVGRVCEEVRKHYGC